MTREEEIINAARERADRHEIAEKELHNYNSQLYFYDRIYNAEIASFEAGVKWADEHPKNVWHDTSEEPRLNQWFLAQIGDNAFDTFVMEMDKNEDWKEWSNGINIKRWAYIRDLLPKGDEK